MTISLCMIVKNEEAVLAGCLDSVRGAVDEIVIVDTGSTDRTKEIARGYTDKVFNFEWVDDFSAARNYAYAQATMDYQMWLDADDVLPPAEREKLLRLKQTLPDDTDIVTMKYHTHFDGNGSPVFTSTRERLTKRSRGYQWQDPVHECIPLTGRILQSDIAVWHQKPVPQETSTRNLRIYESLESQGRAFTPRQQYYFARELKDHGRYAQAAYYFERFLDGGKGWSEDNIAACFSLAACYTALGEPEKALSVLLRSFLYDGPRGEICCELGYYYKRRSDYRNALAWFRTAAQLDPPDSMGFVLPDYWGYIPNIECCVCCCYLSRFDEAAQFNARAGACKPNSPAVRQNEQYLASLRE